MRHWALMPGPRIALGASKKCGSRSLLHIAGDFKRVNFEDIPTGLIRIGIIREPVSRFISLYLHARRGFNFRATIDFYKPHLYAGVEEFWEGIAPRLDEDEHCLPQYKIGLLQADQIIRLDDLTEWCKNVGFVHPHLNQRPKGTARRYTVDMTPELESKIRAAYAQDLSIWENANGN